MFASNTLFGFPSSENILFPHYFPKDNFFEHGIYSWHLSQHWKNIVFFFHSPYTTFVAEKGSAEARRAHAHTAAHRDALQASAALLRCSLWLMFSLTLGAPIKCHSVVRNEWCQAQSEVVTGNPAAPTTEHSLFWLGDRTLLFLTDDHSFKPPQFLPGFGIAWQSMQVLIWQFFFPFLPDNVCIIHTALVVWEYFCQFPVSFQ